MKTTASFHQVPTLAQTVKFSGITLWVPWADGTLYVLSLCDMAGTPEELCHSFCINILHQGECIQTGGYIFSEKAVLRVSLVMVESL